MFSVALSFALVVVGLLALFKWLYDSGLIPRPLSSESAPGPAAVNLTPLAQIILTYNNEQAFWADGESIWTIPAEGVIAHKITADQASATAAELEAVVPSSAPLSVPLALLASESVMDPECVNGNYAGSNPSKSPWGVDTGIAQLKLGDIEIDGKDGAAAFLTAADAQAFAFDVTKALPYFWSIYNAHVAAADKLIAGNTRSDIDQRLMNRWILGALCYKQGDTGAATIFASGQWPTELDNFVSLESYFAAKLGVTSVFAGLT